MLKAPDIRSRFLDYFRSRGHEVVKSSPLVPQGDPSLLFTNAGMNQFKDVFTGRETRAYRRATSSQKCVRAGGKHNDLENVGRTARHHTFFEMLGNFSFGDYFKEDAIAFAWELLVKELGLDPGRLVITVFKGEPSLGLGPDDEARAIWRKVTGFGDDRIIGLGMKDNFWMMGDTGPQGPCSEIHFFNADGPVDVGRFEEEPLPDGTGWMEIWNLVFMQFQKDAKDAPLVPLPKPSIDTGAGLERVTAVLQGKRSNYDTDLLAPLVMAAAEMAKKPYGASMQDDDVSMRVLADHARAASFLIADGVLPSNEGRGYVLRRIMRRAIRHGVRLGLKEGCYRQLCEAVIAEMGGAFPELVEARSLIGRAVDAEDEGFRRTIDRGLRLIDENKEWNDEGGKRVMPGRTVFVLHDTYGFPPDLTRVIGEEKGFAIDEAGYESAMKEQKDRSRFAGSGEQATADAHMKLRELLGPSRFLGYDLATTTRATGRILALLDGKGGRVELAAAGEAVEVVCDQTPFYGEAGGQIGDTGKIVGAAFEIEVTDTIKPGGDFLVHAGKVTKGTAEVGQEVELLVDAERRDAIRRNHSATHLLQWALKQVLGDHVAQKGSLVGPDRLRFDFSHFNPMTPEEIDRVLTRWGIALFDETRRDLQTGKERPVWKLRQKGLQAILLSQWRAYVEQLHALMVKNTFKASDDFIKIIVPKAESARPKVRPGYDKLGFYFVDLPALRPAAEALREEELIVNEGVIRQLEEISQATRAAWIVLLGLLTMFCATAAINLIAVLSLRARQKAPELGMLRAMGMGDGLLRLTIIVEAFLLWLRGSCWGVLCAGVLGAILGLLYLEKGELRLLLGGWWLVFVGLFIVGSLVVCILSALIATSRLRTQPPIVSLNLS